MDQVNVQKKDGSEEPWSYDKLVASLTKSGLPVEGAENMASKVQEWVKSEAKDGIINSGAIRDKLLEIMKSEYPAEAENYQSYKKE
ncbi:hypothetical protein A2863_00675 [Candidatus Woesebacteria bacterium RIFCSPHIGHO2_01_FULL_38_9b]|uniref:ATP-cone domain-containing protein n=1 Tax=Candidatus Woesebacteria bacterium RIFCSPHIGHO2_01_FULL_38_9b TaxID=1802493 RepID=A0A1F7Y5H1_9BACT|nr:MAG: hypothetical protein A2863_00675 [Candidatus Woesebacteria bacterium RIFCSPHIGHO2_01_FULL_38_9b]